MGYPILHDFHLVGSTALSLQLGHRISIDLDLFTSKDFDTENILVEIRKKKNIQVVRQNEQNSSMLNVECPINSKEYVKVDVVKNPYPLLGNVRNEEGLRMLSYEDIIPMKLSAITNRDTKKDLFNIYELLKLYSIEDMFLFFKRKFPDIKHFHVLKSLTSFEDAENDFAPISVNNTDWSMVNEKIEQKVTSFLSK